MRIGLYLDFAVGEVPDGSASWGGGSATVPGMRIGAPPDVFAAQGQEWGLAAVSPVGPFKGDLAGFRREIEVLTRHAGALRIDHVMSLWQLFFVPEGGLPADGAYVRYPLASQVENLLQPGRSGIAQNVKTLDWLAARGEHFIDGMHSANHARCLLRSDQRDRLSGDRLSGADHSETFHGFRLN